MAAWAIAAAGKYFFAHAIFLAHASRAPRGGGLPPGRGRALKNGVGEKNYSAMRMPSWKEIG